MSVIKKILLTLGAFLLVLAVLFALLFRHMYTPTEGPEIAEYDQPGKAVLVIDVQEDFSGLNGKQPVPLPGVEAEIAAINRIIESAESAGIELAYIRQVFDDNLLSRFLMGRAIEGQPGAELDARIRVINKNDFTKPISDAFSNPDIGEFLVSRSVDELYLVGLDAAYCVYYTALGAINRGYKVTVVTDAVMTSRDMDDILEKYADKGINVTTTDALVNELSPAGAK